MIKFKSQANEKFQKFDFAAHHAASNGGKEGGASVERLLPGSVRVPKFELAAFMSQFILFRGIQQFYLEVESEKKSTVTGEKSLKHDEKTGFVNRDENLIRQLRCSKKWPICILDFHTQRTIHEFFVYRMRAPKSQKSNKDDQEEFVLTASNSRSPLKKEDDYG